MSENSFELQKFGIPLDLKNKIILDINCKDGFSCFECEKMGAKVIGVESRPRFHYSSLKLRNKFSSFVNFLRMYIQDINHLNYKFDIVLFLNQFNSLENQSDILKKIFDKLMEKGIFILQLDLSNKNKDEFFIEEMRLKDGNLYHYPNKFAIQIILRKAGFQTIAFYHENSRESNHYTCVIHAYPKPDVPRKTLKDYQVRRYQAFPEDQKDGDSKSKKKLLSLGIPENLKNKNVLDIGCNEGFFCFECEKLGAKEVVGLDKDKKWLTLALKRKEEFSSNVNFLNEDWNNISSLNYNFDLVLFLAAFHYIRDNHLDVLKNINGKMNGGGLLILEIGLSEKNEGTFFIDKIKRPAGDSQHYPNKFTIKKLLTDAGFGDVSIVGKSTGLKDVAPRYVVHAIK